MNYGFAIEDNKYDSYQIQVNIDIQNIKDTSFKDFFEGKLLIQKLVKRPNEN